jgi:hypothetical protein
VTKLDKERRMVADRVKKFEKTAHEIHQMADKLHKKMKEIHLETIDTRERARKAREQAELKGTAARKLVAKRERKVS